MASALTPNDQWKALIMVRALDPAVISVLWQAIYHLLPEPAEHPLGCCASAQISPACEPDVLT